MVRSILFLAAVGLASASGPNVQKHKGLTGHVLSLASTVAPAQPKQLVAQVQKGGAGVSSRSLGLTSRQTDSGCFEGEVVCDDIFCMPADSVCCNDGSGYCMNGYTCISGTDQCAFGGGSSGDGGDDDSGSDSGSDLCDLDMVDCDGICMPLDGVCCNDGSGFCQAGTTCISGTDMCEPNSDSGSDNDDDDDSGSDVGFCDLDQEECDGLCMPAGSVCCNDGSGYCPSDYTCISGTDQCSPDFGFGGSDGDDDDDESSPFPTLPSLTFPSVTETSSRSIRTSETTTTTTTSDDPEPTESDGGESTTEENGNGDNDNGDNGSAASALVPSFLAGVLAMVMVPVLL